MALGEAEESALGRVAPRIPRRGVLAAAAPTTWHMVVLGLQPGGRGLPRRVPPVIGRLRNEGRGIRISDRRGGAFGIIALATRPRRPAPECCALPVAGEALDPTGGDLSVRQQQLRLEVRVESRPAEGALKRCQELLAVAGVHTAEAPPHHNVAGGTHRRLGGLPLQGLLVAARGHEVLRRLYDAVEGDSGILWERGVGEVRLSGLQALEGQLGTGHVGRATLLHQRADLFHRTVELLKSGLRGRHLLRPVEALPVRLHVAPCAALLQPGLGDRQWLGLELSG
jgi:hypothetical protein